MTETLSAGCQNNLGGLRKIILFRAPEVIAISGSTIQLQEDYTATHIIFPDNGAEYNESLKDSENGPFHEVGINANLGRNNSELVTWCNRNRRRKYVAIIEDQNGFQFIVGSPKYPLGISYGSGTGISDQDKNNRQLSLRGRIVNLQEGFGGLVPVEDPSFLVTEDPEVFIVIETGDPIVIL